jgi:hypothetical protein
MNATTIGSVSTTESTRREGPVARAIESRTSKIPSDVFLWAAGGAFAVSGAIQFLAARRLRRFGFRRAPLFVIGRRIELLAPIFLMLGIYNKLVKVHGS